jgi:hypothetical protein
MRSLGIRRVALLAGAVTVAATALAGCSAGQVAETSLNNPGIYGVDTQNSDHSILVRSLAVPYNGIEGYAAGDDAPLEVNLYNETTSPIEVLISSAPPKDPTAQEGVTYARQVGLVGGTPTGGSSASSSKIPEIPAGSRPAASPTTTNEGDQQSAPSPNASENPSAPSDAAAQPARITIGPLGFVSFRPGDAQSLRVFGLAAGLKPGTSVNLVFEFSNGATPLETTAPVGIPLSPASRGPGNPAENEGESTAE